jgi:hypothetical protein
VCDVSALVLVLAARASHPAATHPAVPFRNPSHSLIVHDTLYWTAHCRCIRLTVSCLEAGGPSTLRTLRTLRTDTAADCWIVGVGSYRDGGVWDYTSAGSCARSAVSCARSVHTASSRYAQMARARLANQQHIALPAACNQPINITRTGCLDLPPGGKFFFCMQSAAHPS